MALALGSGTPLGYYVGSTQATAMYLGGTLVYSASPAAWGAYYSNTFTGSNGAAIANWSRATGFPTGGTVNIQSNAMRLATGSTTAWSGTVSAFLGDPTKPGVAPQINPNFDYSFKYTLSGTGQQYQPIAIRARSAEMWPSGGGAGTFISGYNLMVCVGDSANANLFRVEVVRGYDTTSLANITGLAFAATLYWRILVDGKRLAFKVWLTGTEPGGVGSNTNWTYDNPTILNDESDGGLAFGMVNGAVGTQNYIAIDDITITTKPQGGYSGTQPAPTAAVPGFTIQYLEDFNTPAPSGTGTSSFLNVYANSIQPYDESAPQYQQRSLLSAHDSVLDIAMNGTQGAAFAFGTPANANSWIGGRFSMRAKAIGAWGNGPAVMIWPASTKDGPWSDGEIDFPESVSGEGDPIKGFQDSPWIHHHRMNQDMNLAQDVNLGVSWRDWHVYTAEWYPPGKGPNPSTGTVIYYVDNVEVYRTTQDVPNTVHRYMVQVGWYGAPGNMYIDWARIDSVN